MTEKSQIEELLAGSLEELSYEQAFERLEQIVTILESDDHSLDVSVQLYERGQQLAHYCAELLDHAELRILQLDGTEVTEGGEFDG